MKHTALTLLIALALLPLAGQAQWMWVDKDGRKVFSDRAPPSSVPDKSILKRPGQRGAASSPVEAPNTANTPAPTPLPAASAPKLSGLDKELEAKKKKAEQAELEKRKAEEARIAQAKSENCTRAKAAKAGLDSGARIARFNAKGEREVMDNATRQAETQRLQAIIASDCQ